MKTLNYTAYGKQHPITFRVGKYRNDNLAIEMVTHRDGHPEPYGTMTVNLGMRLSEDKAFVDVNNLEGIEDFICDNGLGKATGYRGYSGYCVYPEYQFDLDRIRQFKGGR